MAGDIEDFLRRAAQRRAPQPPASAIPPGMQMLGDDDVIDADIVDADIVEDPGILSGHDVGDHVTRHINTSDFGERMSHMGEDVDRADDRMESHLHEYFEHALGDLGGATSRASNSTLDDDNAPQDPIDPKKAKTKFNIRQLLRSPSSIRDAIVLSEILRKPDFRW